MRTSDKGDIGVAKVTADLIQQDWQVLTPVSSVAPFDLVAYRAGNFRRVQVKYITAKNGSLQADCRITINNKRVRHRTCNDEIDVIGIYCPNTEKCYYVRPTTSSPYVVLRIVPSKNNQKKNVRNAENFRKFFGSVAQQRQHVSVKHGPTG